MCKWTTFSVSIYCGTSGLYPACRYHKQGCYEHSGTHASVAYWASFGHILKSGIAGSSGRFVSIFQNNLQNDFQNGSNSLQSHRQWRSVLLLHILNYIGCHLRFLNVVNLIGIKWNPAVVLISISLITKAFDHSYIFKMVIHL